MRSVAIFLLLFGLYAVLHSPAQPRIRPLTPVPLVKKRPTPQQLNEETLEKVVKLWQQRMNGIKAAKVRYEMIDQDGSIDRQRTHLVRAQYQRPSQAIYFSNSKDNPTNQCAWQHYVMNEDELSDFDHLSRTIRSCHFDREFAKGNSLLFGLLSSLTYHIFPLQLSPTMLHQQFRLSIDVNDAQKFNENFIHILVEPKSVKDSRDFIQAEIVLWINKTNPQYADRWMLPARIWIQQANKDQITWNVKSIECVDSLPKETFEALLPGPDWKWEGRSIIKRK